ncbi:MAG: hypothetical protein AAGJ40_19225 [Planctomycetota bacterium]
MQLFCIYWLRVGHFMDSSKFPRLFGRITRSGQALVEFAIISFVLSAMVAGLLGILVLALGSFQNNIASENAGRVLDQHAALIKENFVSHFEMDMIDPFLSDQAFDELTARQVYRFLNEFDTDGSGSVLYDESRLVLSPNDWEDRENLGLSAINESLLGQYVYDPDLDAYRFPGAIVWNERTGERDPDSDEVTSGLTVLVPLLPEGMDPGRSKSFHVQNSDPEFFYPVADDWVAPVTVEKVANGTEVEFRLILFHPSQPGSLISLEIERDSDGRIISQTPVEANDGSLTIGALPDDYQLETPDRNTSFGASTSRGQYGLGEALSFLTTVRPYRSVFETASVFRPFPSPQPTVKYVADGSPITLIADPPSILDVTDTAEDPFDSLLGAFDDNDPDERDQAMELDQPVVSSDLLVRYFTEELPSTTSYSSDNSFVRDVLRLLPDDDGLWRVSVSAQFTVSGAVSGTDYHRMELRLYKNGVYERLIEEFVGPVSDGQTITLLHDVVSNCVEGDLLQVRVFTERPTGETYDIVMTGDAITNWVSFERIEN